MILGGTHQVGSVSIPSGATQFGRKIFWLSMKENRVCAMSSLACRSSSI